MGNEIQDQGVSAEADRAVVNRAGQAVTALRASIPDAARRVLSWAGPFGMAMVGLSCFGAAIATDNIALGVVGGLLMLSGFDSHAERARMKEQDRWAKMIAGMIRDEGETVFRVEHSFQNIRPEVESIIQREVALATVTREGGDADSVSEANRARAEGNAQGGSDGQ